MKTKKSRATQSYHTSAKGKAFGGNSLGKTRQRLPSEAFAKDLQTTPLPRVGSQSPQRLGVGGLKKSPPLRKRGVGGFDIIKEKIANFPYSGYQPAPTEVGGASGKPTPLNSTDLRKSKEIICKDRQTRREVLFALGKAGKGSNVKEAKWTLASLVRCD